MFEMQISDALKSRLVPQARVVVLTGAGVSAESGVPTFRGKDGLWKKFRPEELATFEAFMANPKLVWEWYQYRRELIENVKPNPAHYALVEFQKYFKDFSLITQNVDGLHQLAGCADVIELHGNIKRNRCTQCEKKLETLEIKTDQMPPRCQCGGKIRPDVVWFGEMLPQDASRGAFEISSSCDLFFSLGTSAVVHPAASLPLMAKRSNAYLVEVNIEPTGLSSLSDELLLGKAGEVMPFIVKNFK